MIHPCVSLRSEGAKISFERNLNRKADEGYITGVKFLRN